jgi:beta-barrel assembly-enhancing protease
MTVISIRTTTNPRMHKLVIALCLWLATAAAAQAAATAAPAPQQSADDERSMGAQLFNELKSEGEIVETSPLYDALRPLSIAITQAVQPRYAYPIHFYIVHEAQPNAFAAPGGNIYVTDAMFYFVKNTEELAGTICHETSHLLNHDSMKKMQEEQKIRDRAVGATILLGPSVSVLLATAAIGELDSMHYSRDVEERADLMGADTCAHAGYNPWGLVWLFSDFENSSIKQPPEIISDHPDDQHRVQALEHHFQENPALFGGFNGNPKSATPMHVSHSEPEVFLR